MRCATRATIYIYRPTGRPEAASHGRGAVHVPRPRLARARGRRVVAVPRQARRGRVRRLRVQGLVATRAGAASITWVEAEARAAAFCRLNGALNCVAGDVVVDRVNNVADGTYDVILGEPALRRDAFFVIVRGLRGRRARRLRRTERRRHLRGAAPRGGRFVRTVASSSGTARRKNSSRRSPWPGRAAAAMNARCCVVHDVLTERTSPKAVAERRGGAQSDAWLANYRDQNINCVANAGCCSGGQVEGRFDWAEGACARAWAPPPSNVERGRRRGSGFDGVRDGQRRLSHPRPRVDGHRSAAPLRV